MCCYAWFQCVRSFWQAACENLVGVKMGAIEEWDVADPQVVMEWSALCIVMHCHAITTFSTYQSPLPSACVFDIQCHCNYIALQLHCIPLHCAIQPYLKWALRVFGFRRCMAGSNWCVTCFFFFFWHGTHTHTHNTPASPLTHIPPCPPMPPGSCVGGTRCCFLT